ncbi:hypothetical protein D2M30_2529 [Bacillus amyloliquefaciens]|nr:hypothetical protein D2M30_2529 [Bacillus amyloliquefaciens]
MTPFSLCGSRTHFLFCRPVAGMVFPPFYRIHERFLRLKAPLSVCSDSLFIDEKIA